MFALAHFMQVMVSCFRSQEDLHGCTARFLRYERGWYGMKKDDFISLTGWLFSLLSLLIAVYLLGKG